MNRFIHTHRWTLAALLLAFTLAAGWIHRERAFAQEKAQLLESQTVTQAALKSAPFVFDGTTRGTMGLYFNGRTAGTRGLVVGQFVLNPGEEPHPIHTHVEDEILIVTSGDGEIICAGKTTAVSAGSAMYTTPNVPHGIRNTGKTPLTFYFIKWDETRP
jgi:quercetin dioxygenase-like cupin family protein